VFLVSHDRTFLDNVVTSTIAYEGNARWREYEGGVQDWLVQSQRARALGAKAAIEAAKPAAPAPIQDQKPPESTPAGAPVLSKKKLSYKDQRELDALPSRIAVLEAEQKAIRADLADGTLYAKDTARAVQLQTRDVAIDEELLGCLERWEALGT
jgi:ATP-binding cassette subfamily F protein uup